MAAIAVPTRVSQSLWRYPLRCPVRAGERSWRPAPTCSSTSISMSAWESTLTPSLRKLASCSIIALRNSSESPILSSSATVYSFWVDWSLPKEPHGGRPRQQLRLLHTPRDSTERRDQQRYTLPRLLISFLFSPTQNGPTLCRKIAGCATSSTRPS